MTTTSTKATGSDQTYIYDDIEVKTTGRTASKALPGGKEALMHEITPLDENLGTWKKWVNLQSLFRIVMPQTPH